MNTQPYPAFLIDLLPPPDRWSDQDYLWLSGRTNKLLELVDGTIEVVAMPTERHQALVILLLFLLRTWTAQNGGTAFIAPLRLRTAQGRFREPDLLLLKDVHDPRRGNNYWSGADLVIKVVSPDDPQHDYGAKRHEYAQAQIPEYWIVDPRTEHVLLLILQDGTYQEHQRAGRGEQLYSPGLDLTLDLTGLFDAE